MGYMPPWEINRSILERAEESTNPSVGIKPSERSIEEYIKYGVIVIDKQSGPTSHEIVAWVKKLLELDRAGHGGTLDPKVTGVLPIAYTAPKMNLDRLMVSSPFSYQKGDK